jgi:hypothetical protein
MAFAAWTPRPPELLPLFRGVLRERPSDREPENGRSGSTTAARAQFSLHPSQTVPFALMDWCGGGGLDETGVLEMTVDGPKQGSDATK